MVSMWFIARELFSIINSTYVNVFCIFSDSRATVVKRGDFHPAKERNQPAEFQCVESSLPKDGRLKDFVRYVMDWRQNMEAVGVDRLHAVSTSNNVEDGHHGFHRRASNRCQLPLYLLIDKLHLEARLTSLHIRFVSWNKLRRIQRKPSRNLQLNIFGLEEEFINGNRSAR